MFPGAKSYYTITLDNGLYYVRATVDKHADANRRRRRRRRRAKGVRTPDRAGAHGPALRSVRA